MASNNKDKRNKSLLGNRTIKNNLALLNKSLTDLYQDTYYSTRTDLDDSTAIRSDIERSVETIMHNNLDNSSVGNISRMYAKMGAASKDNQNLLDAIKELNDDTLTQTVLSSWVQNKWIKDLNAEIDMVLKYAPKLREALLCKKDCVLSADHFSKEFLNFTNLLSSLSNGHLIVRCFGTYFSTGSTAYAGVQYSSDSFVLFAVKYPLLVGTSLPPKYFSLTLLLSLILRRLEQE